MADAINAKSDVLGERELDCVSGGIKGALEEMCRNDEGTSYPGSPAQLFQRILQQMTQA